MQMKNIKKHVASDNQVQFIVVEHGDIKTKLCQASDKISQIMTHTQNHCVHTFCVLHSLARSRTQENMEVAHAVLRSFLIALKTS